MWICDRYDREQYDKGYADGKRDAMDELVRCKDCKHYYRPLQWPVEYTKGMCDVDLFERRVHPDDYCSYGEKKEAEGDG